MEDEVLALCELSNDLVYEKIPEDKLRYYIGESLKAGREAALPLEGRDILELYRENRIRIHYQDRSPGKFGVLLRGSAEMDEKECGVTLYRASIAELAGHAKSEGEPLLDYDGALRIHLAHEFYHFQEYRQGSVISARLDPVVTLRIGRYARTAHVRRCEEIAAHAFAKELLGLPVLPNYYDYLYLIDTGAMTKADFDKMLERRRALLKAGD